MSFTITLSSVDNAKVFNNNPVSFTYACPKEISLSEPYEVAVISLQFEFNKQYKTVRRTTNATGYQPLTHDYRSFHVTSQLVPLQCVGNSLLPTLTSFSGLKNPLKIFKAPNYVALAVSKFNQIQVRILSHAGNIAVDLEKYIASTHIKLHFRRS